MAYNYGINPYMTPNYSNYFYPQYPVQANQQNTQQNPDVLNNGGLISVPSEEDVLKYPIAPGNIITFKIENQPIIIEKSMSRSQFDSPHYKRYKLVEEEMNGEGINNTPKEEKPVYAQIEDIQSIKTDIETLQKNYSELKESFEELRKTYNRKTKTKGEGESE